MLRASILVLALLAGGAAAWLSVGASGAATLPVVAGPDAAAAAPLAPAVPLHEVLVAATAVEAGALLQPDSLRWQPWPQDALSESLILRGARPDAAEALVGMVARGGFVAGEPVIDAKVAEGGAGVLAIMLEPGRRAVAVRISAENTAGGFILPEDRVDVLHTTTQTGSDGQASASSRVILSDVRVLAIDQAIDNASGSIVGKTATLELAPGEAEVVTAAEAAGTVSLALRSVADKGRAEPVAEPEEVVASSLTVRVFRAGQESAVEVD